MFESPRGIRALLVSSLLSAVACSTLIGIDQRYTDDATADGNADSSTPGAGQGGGSSSGDGGALASGGSPAHAGGSGQGGGSCGGVLLDGVCWYLGALGQSCASTCAGRSGNSPAAAGIIGVAAQGGSLAQCARVLDALGVQTAPTEAGRTDGRGLGCHLYGTRAYWLATPAYGAEAALGIARLACGCNG